MAVQPFSDDIPQGQSGPESNAFQDRTFMGGIGLSTRSSLFAMLGIVVLICGGFGLNFADKELTRADTMLRQATDLNTFAAAIERDVWRIRAEQGKLSIKSSDATRAATQEHLALTSALGQKLDDLYQRPGAAPMGEHVSTLREAVAQYSEQYEKSMQQVANPGPDLTDLEANMRRAIRSIGKTLTALNSLSINETMMAIRAATTEFVEAGLSRDLIVIEGHQKEFYRLLISIPMPQETKSALQLGINDYNNALTAYAKVKLVANNTRDRLDEIISYMAPSVDAISGFSGDHFVETEAGRTALRQQYRTLIAAGGAGAVMLMLLFGLAMLRSISGPVSAAAKAAKSLRRGDTDIVVWGLANEDETGDIARAFWALKGSLIEAKKLGEEMEKTRSDAERGRAASAETEWLRRDLESMKAEADKGKEALAEVALLRKVIDATADTIGEKQIAKDNEAPPAPAPSTEVATEMSLDSISSISRQVARSSESVTAAADEAERTGTLIRNLSDASGKIGAIENLIALIGEQSDMLVINAPPQSPDTNLVILNGDARADAAANPDAIAQRFDAIRAAASKANWAVRDIGALIRDSRDVALDIARLSSSEALEVTTDLLQQSENLRGMLDNLVHKMQDQITDVPDQQTDDEDLLS
jgi:methyl-accepting chemotaxis protein